MNKKIIICCLIIGLLLLSPVSAKIITSKVDDKRIMHTYGPSFTVHTVDFGDIRVYHNVYNQIMINDTISFSDQCDETYHYYTVYRINGVLQK